MSHTAHILVKILIILPWLRTPSSSSTCHMPTAWVRKWTQGLCCIIQSTSSVPTQHCLKDRETDRNEKEASQERDCTQRLPRKVISWTLYKLSQISLQKTPCHRLHVHAWNTSEGVQFWEDHLSKTSVLGNAEFRGSNWACDIWYKTYSTSAMTSNPVFKRNLCMPRDTKSFMLFRILHENNNLIL